VNVIAIFEERARRHAAQAAIVDGRAGGERTTTFAELDRQSRQIAALFLRQGLQPGDAVAVFVPMSAELYAIVAALLRLAMVPVFVEPTAWRETLDRAMASLPVRGFIGIPAACAMRLLVPALRRVRKVFVVGPFFPGATGLRAARALAPSQHLESVAADQAGILTFTSGSTGRPKAVVRSHGVLAATHRLLSMHLELEPGDLDVALLPIVVLANLGCGVGSLIPQGNLTRPGAIDARRLTRQIEAWSPAGIVASPSLLEGLADEAADRSARLASLRRIVAGGAPVFPRVLDKLAKAVPAARIRAVYGATEAEPIAMLDRDEFGADERRAMHRGAGLLAGRPIDHVRLRILRDRAGEPCGPWTREQFDAACLGERDVGEIVVSGEHVVAGYLDGQGDRELKIRVGSQTWHRTGDAGCLDARGRLWLHGSCRARVDLGSVRRYPLAVDAALSDDTALARSALVRHDGRVLLVVQPRGERAAAEVRSAVSQAAAWAGAQELVAVRRMPLDRRHDAKIDHPQLQRLLDGKRWLWREPIARAWRTGCTP
jgi:acyl-CoA synthetase (AMP-forming)/AMP-acid ligase II